MPIENRELAVGTRLVARYKRQERTCEVMETSEGLRYGLDDGTEHKSPSSAGKAVTGIACNGWVFWSLMGTEKPKGEPNAEKVLKAAPTKPAKTKVTKNNKSAKKQKVRAARRDASYACAVCPETFPTMEDATTHALTHTG